MALAYVAEMIFQNICRSLDELERRRGLFDKSLSISELYEI